MSTYSDVHDLKTQLFDTELVAALADTFKVLGDATRVRILDVLSRRELCVGDVASILGLTESAVSHQLRLLRNARLVRARRAGQMVFYALDDHHVVRLFAQGSEHVRERAGGLAALDTPRSDSLAAIDQPRTESLAAVNAPGSDSGVPASTEFDAGVESSR